MRLVDRGREGSVRGSEKQLEEGGACVDRVESQNENEDEDEEMCLMCD
jgi:hypothetical protein